MEPVILLLIAMATFVLLAAALRALLRHMWRRIRDKYTESPLERALAQELTRQGLAFRREYRISRTRVDFAFPEQKLAVECDGWRYHGSPEQRKRDSARDSFLRREGWRVLRFSGNQIRADVRACVRKIRESL